MTSQIDFEGINAAALRCARSLLPDLIPGGKFRSLEYIVRNPRRNDQHPGSFSINYRTGIWKDFATGDGGGDFVSLVAFLQRTSQAEAVRWLADKLGVPLYKSNGIVIASTSNGTGAIPIAETLAPKVHQWGSDGPPVWSDEVRRNVYKRDGIPVKIKIKRSGGERYSQCIALPAVGNQGSRTDTPTQHRN